MHIFNRLGMNALGGCRAALGAVLLLAATAAYRPAEALPLFARQTGEACAACHVVYPELTHFGRMFKMNGYQLDNGRDIEMTADNGKQVLALPAIPNLALFIMADYTQFKKPLPDSQIAGATSLNGGVDFPYQVSLLYGGKIAPHFGAFAQITYNNGSNTFNIDNSDFRFANTIVLPNKQPLAYGVSINNNPSVEDAYNTTPAFGFPYLPPGTFVPSLATPIIEQSQAYKAAGPVAYLLWNEQLYVAAGFYREARNGGNSPGNAITALSGPIDSTTSSVLYGNNPYWRVAYEYDINRFNLEVGTYGLNFKVLPGNGLALSGATNNYTDIAEDFQFQFIGEDHQMTLKGTYVKESQALNASYAAGASAAHDWLSYATVDLDYWYQRRFGFDVGFVNIHGSTDPVQYPSSPTMCVQGGGGTCNVPAGTPGAYVVGVTNSANSNPTTDAAVGEVSYVPWLNVKFTLQYTHYTKFNGATTNYDGNGRNASANDTTFFYIWYAM